jgi:VWFA-related protein
MGVVSGGRGQLRLAALLAAAFFFIGSALGQSTTPNQDKSQKPQTPQNIPDAPSAVQPPPTQEEKLPTNPMPMPATPNGQGNAPESAQEPQTEPPPPMPPVQTLPPGTAVQSGPNSSAQQQLYRLVITSNFVQVPVTVKDSQGRLVDGLLAKDFSVYENGKKQTLTFFTSDPFELSVALIIDLGMPDVAVQKVNQTFPALVGAFSPYDEVALYTYSSTVSDASDFGSAADRLSPVLNQLKTVRGNNNGPPVLSGPLAPNGPITNGIPMGSPTQPVYTPPRQAHVLNDAILRAALDLSKREKTRRKVIFVISDGRELGSKASYSDVLKVLLAQGIQVKAIAVEGAALPVYDKLERLHLPRQGYNNILPRYVSATGGGEPFSEYSRSAIEDAYARLTSEARNQYTLGYTTRASASSMKREIEVRVDRPNLQVFAKDGYYPVPSAR